MTPKQQFLQEYAAGQHRQYSNGSSGEYAWRIKSNMERGATRSEARGHARRERGERPVSETRNKQKRTQSRYKVAGTKHTRTSYSSIEALEKRIARSKGQDIMVMVESGGATYTTRSVRIRGNADIALLIKDLQKILNQYGFGGRDDLREDIDPDEESPGGDDEPEIEFSVVRITNT